jgi:hypothetical protein
MESFFIQTVADPLPGVSSRSLSLQGATSAARFMESTICRSRSECLPGTTGRDVTPEHKNALFIKSGKYSQGEPSVKYRGIFFNDEKPDLDYWVRAKFGEHPTPVAVRDRCQFQQQVLQQGL